MAGRIAAMNQNRIPYKVHMSAEFIRKGISSSRFLAGSVLPPIKQLAALAGVSYVTMWKAVQLLQKQGDLLVIPGQLIKVCGEPPESEQPTADVSPAPDRSSRQSWYRIKEELQKDVLRGAYEAGSTLPRFKELGSRYSTSYQTLAKALDALCRERLLHASGRRFKVGRQSPPGSNAEVCVLVHRDYVDRYVSEIPEGQHDYLHPIEFHGAKAMVKVMIAECSFVDDQLVPDDVNAVFPRRDSSARPILGYIYIMSHATASRRMFQLLKAQRKPVSILDDNGSLDRKDLPPGSPFFRIFPVASGTVPGRDVGRYLLGLGHTGIAFFSPWQDAAWSANRLQGLEDICARAGYVHAVRPFTLDAQAWLGADAQGIEPAQEGSKDPFGGSRQDVSQSVLDRRRRYAKMNYGSEGDPVRSLFALFARALKDRNITAWVAANDTVATMGLDFLHEKGIRVPRRISVVSFDDTAAAIAYRLTSYNFNLSAIVGAAFRHVLESPAPQGRGGPQRMEIEGLVVERGSAATRPSVYRRWTNSATGRQSARH